MKKLLALVLALVMSMSLVTISNAADFKDADKIDNLEAVLVMKGVGVLDGYTDGSFGPTDTLTRAQACKIVAYLDLGAKAADALTGTGKVFTDVAANNWAAGFIEYCAQAGYVAGVGDGKFDPNAKVTGLQFAKMLLVVLGYDAAIEGLVGSAWEINAAKLGADRELFENIAGKTNVALTRQEAAQIAFNTINAVMVQYPHMDREGYFGKVENVAGNKLYRELKSDYKDLEKKPNGEDEFGRPTSVWKLDGKEICNAASSAEKVYLGKVKSGTIYSDFDLTETKSYSVYSVDKDTGVFTQATKSVAKKGEVVIGDVGSMTEVFTDDDGDITKIVNIPYYVGKITAVTEADEDDEDSKRKITVDGKDYETESFAKDDIVVYTVGQNDDGNAEIMSVKAAEAVSGKVTASKGSKLTVSGTAYTKMSTVHGNPAVGNEGTFYLNVDGSIAYFVEKDSATGAYAYIYNVTSNDSDTDEDGNTSTTYTAYYVGADGVKAKAKLAKDDDGKVLGGQGTSNLNALRGVYEYELTDDGMKKIDNTGIGSASTNLSSVKIDTGKYADSKTVFVYAYEKDGKVTSKVITGIKNVEKYDAPQTVYYVSKDDAVSYVFVTVAPADAETDATYAVLLDNEATITKSDDGKTTYYTYDVLAGGKKTTLTAKNSSTKLSGAGVVAGDVFEYTLENDYLKTVTEKTGDIAKQNVAKVIENSVVFETAGAYTVAEDAVVYVIKADGTSTTSVKGSVGTVAKDNKALAFVNDDNELTLIVVDKR